MSLVEPTPSWDAFAQPADRLLTAADLDAFPTDLPSGPVDYELDNGRLVFIMAPPGDNHGSAQVRIGGHLYFQGELKGHGKARTEGGLLLWRNPDRVVAPDAAFIANKSLPLRTTPEGYLQTIPELVVEIRSKNDSAAYLRRKVAHYLKAGVEVVWVVDPETQTVAVHRPHADPVRLGPADALDLPDLVPDFRLPLADVFRD